MKPVTKKTYFNKCAIKTAEKLHLQNICWALSAQSPQYQTKCLCFCCRVNGSLTIVGHLCEVVVLLGKHLAVWIIPAIRNNMPYSFDYCCSADLNLTALST